MQALLCQKGQPILTHDIWVAAIVLQYNLSVSTYNKYFSAVDNLVVVNTLLGVTK